MCGLVAILGKPSYRMGKIFDNLLQVDVIRGPHSTGVCAVTEKNIYLQKTLLAPTDLIYTTKYQRRISAKRHDISCYIGHNRHATVGKVTKRNAHPFQHGHITMIHNGTLHRHLTYGKETFETDSESICHYIAKQGPRKMWKQLDGAAALMWWDSRDKTLNVLKNSKRSLFFRVTADKEQVIFASEEWMISGLCDREDVKLHPTIWRPNENFLFKFKYDEKTRTVSHTSEELAPYVYKARDYRANNMYGQNSQQGMGFHVNHNTPAKGKRKIYTKIDAKHMSFFRYSPVDLGYYLKEGYMEDNGEILSIAEYHKKNPLAQVGTPPWEKAKTQKKAMTEEEFHDRYQDCIFCDGPLTHEYEESVIIDTKSAVCEDCAKVSEVEGLDLATMVNSL